MSSNTLLAIANSLLPEMLLQNFKMTKYDIKGEEIYLYFTELNTILKQFEQGKLSSKGFCAIAMVQDFQIRGKNAFLCITLRRWLNETMSKVGKRDILVTTPLAQQLSQDSMV